MGAEGAPNARCNTSESQKLERHGTARLRDRSTRADIDVEQARPPASSEVVCGAALQVERQVRGD